MSIAMKNAGNATSASFEFTGFRSTRQSAYASPKTKHDFLDFLGAAQRLLVDFLPITWQSALDSIGEGATAKVYQNPVNADTTLAFKRLKQWRFDSEESGLSVLLAEVLILGHFAFQNYAHIVNLEGICWDVVDDEESVWPVLVFEKSHQGDLNEFMISGPGSGLDFEERLELILEILSGICMLHHAGVVHGDIKPENVLIFEEDNGNFIAKVSDFGYSTLFATEEDLIFMPYSEPWTAPEYHHRGFRPSQAKKLDAYSFGMLVLWLLFYNTNLNIVRDFRHEVQNLDTNILDHALLLLENSQELEAENKAYLEELFRATLEKNPETRSSSFRQFGKLLFHNVRYIDSPLDAMSYPQNDFQIALSLSHLIETDYRVRNYITRCLEKRSQQSCPNKSHLLNLAFCYELGFGVQRDSSKSSALLEKGEIAIKQLEDLINHVKTDPQSLFNETELDFKREALDDELSLRKCEESFKRLESLAQHWKENEQHIKPGKSVSRGLVEKGHFPLIDLSQVYRQEGRSSEAELQYQREIDTMETVLGVHHVFLQYLRIQLLLILQGERRWEDVWKLRLRILEIHETGNGKSKNLSQYNSVILSSYMGLGRWNETEEMQAELIAAYKSQYGTEHPSILLELDNLAMNLIHQQRFQEAESHLLEIVDSSNRILGLHRPETLVYMTHLAWVYAHQGRVEEAEKLVIQVVETAKENLGQENEDTLWCVSELMSFYGNQGRLEEAEKLALQLVQGFSKRVGVAHPGTQNSLQWLIWTYQCRGLHDEAAKVQKQLSGGNQEEQADSALEASQS